MKPITEIYPECIKDGKERFVEQWDYKPLLDSLGYETLLQVDDDDYQGDSRLLLRDSTRYGLLIFGWGSCSGCDALQGCESIKEIEELRTRLHNSIKWFDTPTECLHYFETHDWRGDYSWSDKETKHFVKEGKLLLAKVVAEQQHGTTTNADTKQGTTMRQPKLEIYQDAAGEWRWRVRAKNGKIIADSGEGYKTKSGAEKAWERLSLSIQAAGLLEALIQSGLSGSDIEKLRTSKNVQVTMLAATADGQHYIFNHGGVEKIDAGKVKPQREEQGTESSFAKQWRP